MAETKRKKVVAFTAGRRGGNTEIYMKVALQAISEMGIDVELIRLNECDIHPCIACPRGKCHAFGPDACIFKDDTQWLAQKFLESDGYLLGAPVWSLSPNGIVTDFRDRVFGPKMDLAGWEMHGGAPEWANGNVKQRPGGLISVGGALTEHWTSMGLATLYTTTYPCNLCANKIAQVGIRNIVYFEPYPMEEAKNILNKHNIKQTPFEGVTYNGYSRLMEVLR